MTLSQFSSMWKGEKITIRGLERSDLSLTRKWVNSPQNIAWEGHPFPVSEEEEQVWFEETVKSKHRKALIGEDENGGPIGLVYFDIDWRHRSANLSITIGELEQQGKGYGTDAITTVLRHAFEELGLNRISAAILASNARSISVFEKAGFKREGLRRESYVWHGVFQDQVLMSILRSEYAIPRYERAGK